MMRRLYSKKSRIIIYISAIIFPILSLTLLASMYIMKNQIIINPAEPADYSSKILKDGAQYVEMPVGQFNYISKDFIKQNTVLREGVGIEQVFYEFSELNGKATDELYINVVNGNDFIFSFVADSSIVFADTSVNATSSNIKFGKYKLPVLGDLIWNYLNLPKEAAKSFSTLQYPSLQYPSDVKSDETGNVTLTYTYNPDALAQRMSEILAESDDRKISLHAGKGTVDSGIIALAKAKSATYEDAINLIKLFEQEPDNFLHLSYLLNPEGISKLCESFGEDYYEYVTAERLTQLSEDEINSDINNYHKQLSRMLLQYLYKNSDYYVSNGALYLNGNRITEEAVISSMGGVPGVYTTEIMADENSLSVKYVLSGLETIKVIFNNNIGQ